jgi:hypothetical protein
MLDWLLSGPPKEPRVHRIRPPHVRQAVVDATPKGVHVVRLTAETEPTAAAPYVQQIELDLDPDAAEELAGRLIDTARKARRCNDFRRGR